MSKVLLVGFLLVLILAMQSVYALDGSVFLGDYVVRYSYFGVEEGDKFTLTITIENEGDEDKEKVKFELDDTKQFEIDSDKEWDIENLSSEDSVSHTFRIEVDSGVPEGEYDLEFILEDDEDDFEDEIKIEVESDTADLIVSDVTSTPKIIGPDEEDIKLEVTIENIGGGDANFLRAKLELPEGFTPSSSFSDGFNIGAIEAKDSKVATFFIDSDKTLKSGVSEAKLNLEYKSDVRTFQRSLSLDLPVKGKPLFIIIGSRTDPKKVMQGVAGMLRIEIQNIGEEEGEETSVRVFENTDLPLDFDEKTNFVGNLKKGESGTAIFRFEVDSDGAVNEYLVKIQVRAVNRGNVIVSDYTVPITIVKKEKRSLGGTMLIALPVLIIVLIVLIFVSNRRRVSSEEIVY